MEIVISDQHGISTFQERFHSIYPFLKLEFFSKPPVKGRSFPRMVKDSEKTFGEIRSRHDDDTLELIISPDMTVTEVEQLFSLNYGLQAQVLRKSGRIWLETTITDSWTLAEQNREGEILSKEIAGE